MYKYLIFSFLALCGSGCATIFSGTTDEVMFTSEPSGAMVIVDGYQLGRTPLVANLKRRVTGEYVTYDLRGYELISQPIRGEFNVISLLNLLWWPGFIVDAATGAIVRIEYDTYFVELEPLPEAEGEGDGPRD